MPHNLLVYEYAVVLQALNSLRRPTFFIAMAGQNSVALLEEPHPVGEDDSLDEEVEQLLRDAEARLRAKHSAAQHEGDSTRPAWTEPPQLKLAELHLASPAQSS